MKLVDIIILLAMAIGCSQTPDSPVKDEINPPAEEQITDILDPSTNIYGYVLCDGKGLPDVYVSDGYKLVKTDDNGLYQLSSGKKLGYVFVCIPSGYTVASDGVLPQFYKSIDKKQRKQEVDFEFYDDGDQSEYEMLVIGDVQLARRSDDIAQFTHFTSEINQYLKENKNRKIYGLTLGDATWDSHWLSGPYGFSDYLKDINKISGIQIFHTMGNHDHELEVEGDFLSSAQFRDIIGPTYYSFNIGEYHYVVLDNIECTNDGTGEKATYNTSLVKEQMNWLKLDLATVSKDTPIVVAMHAPLYKNSGSLYLDNASDLIECFSGFNEVTVFSGHTHIMYNVDKRDRQPSIMELNSGAVCGTWWYTGHDHPWLHIGKDGSPGGYRVVDVSGKNMTWYFKGIEQDAETQFRSYDRNEICIDVDRDAPDAKDEYKEKLLGTLGEYGTENKDNWIYINVWDWDPSWKVEVTENGKPLDVIMFEGTDPLHVLAYNVTRANMNKSLSFPSINTRHLFKAKASASDTPVTITVTDRFGRVYSEVMSRPKIFTVEAYMK